MPDDPNQQLILDLGKTLRDTIDTYIQGHAIPVAVVVGTLHCIAHEVMMENMMFDTLDGEDADEAWGDLDDGF